MVGTLGLGLPDRGGRGAVGARHQRHGDRPDRGSRGVHGLQHRRICLLGAVRRPAVSPDGQPGLRRAGDDRLQHRDPDCSASPRSGVRSTGAACRIFLVGGILGVPAGVYLLLHLPTGAYRDVIGGLLIVYGGYLLLRRPARSLRTGPLADACAGFLGGLTGGLAGFPGAFVTIWCGLKGWDKARQRGVYQPFILCMQPVTLIAIHLMRPSSPTAAQLDWKTLAFVPAALLGAWFGLRIFKRLSDRQFELAVNALLILSGIGLIALNAATKVRVIRSIRMRRRNMDRSRCPAAAFVASAMAMVAAPALRTRTVRPTSRCCCAARWKRRRRIRATRSSGTISARSRPPRAAGSRPSCSRAGNCFPICRSARRCCRGRSRWRRREAGR